jgi:hypothetical protein
MLADHGMTGTFYIISGRVGRPDSPYMSWSQVQTIYDAGNEIGGHTRNHVHLIGLTAQQDHDEICGGRDDLLARGYPQVSFAYPFGDHDATSEGQVQACGYISGRSVSGLQKEVGEPDAESIPPKDQWVVRTRGSIDVNDHLDEVEDWIMKAEAVDAGNGNADAWIPLVFHHLCDPAVTDCSDPNGVDDQYMTPADFDSLLDFIQAREPTTQVTPMAQVMDPVAPTSQISCNGAACQSSVYGAPVSVTLSANDTGGAGVSGVRNIRYTTDGSNPTESSPTYSGPIIVASTTTIRFRAEDNARNVEFPNHSQTVAVAPPSQSAGGTLGALAAAKIRRNGTAKLVFVLGGPGHLHAVDAGTGKSVVAGKKRRRARVRRVSKVVAQPGVVTLVIRPTKAGRRILQRKRMMKAPVRVTFAPLSGAPTSQTVKLKLRLNRHRRA